MFAPFFLCMKCPFRGSKAREHYIYSSCPNIIAAPDLQLKNCAGVPGGRGPRSGPRGVPEEYLHPQEDGHP